MRHSPRHTELGEEGYTEKREIRQKHQEMNERNQMGEGGSRQSHAAGAPRSSVMNEALTEFIVLDAVPSLLLGAIPSSSSSCITTHPAPQPLPALAMGMGWMLQGHPHTQHHATAENPSAGRATAGPEPGREREWLGWDFCWKRAFTLARDQPNSKSFLACNEMDLTRLAWSCGGQCGMWCLQARPKAGFPAGKELSPIKQSLAEHMGMGWPEGSPTNGWLPCSGT